MLKIGKIQNQVLKAKFMAKSVKITFRYVIQ